MARTLGDISDALPMIAFNVLVLITVFGVLYVLLWWLWR